MLCQAMPTSRSAETAALPVWKEPTQARGRARVAAILDAARDLAVEAGDLDLKMSAVAERAGVPIGSVYQFFPNRTALLARLFAREMAPIDRSLQAALDGVSSIETAVSGIAALIRAHAALVKDHPGLFVIWSTPMIDPVLQAADFENSRANARRITERFLALTGRADAERDIWETALLICHLWGHVIRLLIMLDGDDGDNTVLDQYAAMIEARFRQILGDG